MRFKLMMILAILSSTLHAQSYMSFKKEAIKLFKEKKIATSYKKTKDFIKSHPKDVRGKNLLATLYYWNGEYKKSNKILVDILKSSNYDESKKLYSYVQKKLKKSTHTKVATIKKATKPKKEVSKTTPKKIAKEKIDQNDKLLETAHLHVKEQEDVKNSSKHDFGSLMQANKDEDLDEFDRLAALIESDPNDLKSRELLAKYYMKTGLYQRSYDFAKEALLINPENEDMKKIVSYLSKRADIDTSKKYEASKIVDITEAKEKLKSLFNSREYNAYLNLYKALKDSGIKMNKKENENALFCAVSLGEFKFAKNIIANEPLPHSRYKDRVQALLQR